MAPNTEETINAHFKQVYGQDASFRDGQLEAIRVAISGERALIVQKTGWGKSLVYFLATRLLREMGRGPTIVISPLLALMNNQMEATRQFGLVSATINSTNTNDWEYTIDALLKDQVDILFVSPERLGNQEFMEKVISQIQNSLGILVIDEAHCISDWGHDFRPDYQRITQIVQFLPSNTPLLATTATANNRVIEDIRKQLGDDIFVLRGPLTRESLYIQIIHLSRKEERLAWLAENVGRIPGTGIIYCLTVSDCHSVSDWLMKKGISAYPYTGRMDSNDRTALEQRFLNNDMKVLVATVAFGMGIDKPDIGFVVHYQKPGNVVAYYQQIGRAGRNIANAYAVLLVGEEDDEISEYFIETAFPTLHEIDEVLAIVSVHPGASKPTMAQYMNMSYSRLENALKYLQIHGFIYKEKSGYFRAAKAWLPDYLHSEDITRIRRIELAQMNVFASIETCYMRFVANELNDDTAHDCDHCANCRPDTRLPESVVHQDVLEALDYLRNGFLLIEPKKKWPNGLSQHGTSIIMPADTFLEGYALSQYADAGWGRIVRENKYKDQAFCQSLLDASAEFLAGHVARWNIQWVASIPSLRRPKLVHDFAQALAHKLRLPYRESIMKAANACQQKELNNSYGQCKNALSSFSVTNVNPRNVLLIDDMVDSKWTLTVCSHLLIRKGANAVYVFALANSAGSTGGND